MRHSMRRRRVEFQSLRSLHFVA